VGILIVGALCVAYFLVGVYTDHRQTCRCRRRRQHTAVVAAVHRQDFAETCKVIGGSGGRR
jgi:hypothetical protein